MSRLRAVIRFAGAAALAACLSGCISLLPKSKPSQLYRFGQAPVAAEAAADQRVAALGVLKGRVDFPRAAAGDRILTIGADGRAAYAAEARWISPAVVLFNEALERAMVFNGGVRLISRPDQGKPDVLLRSEVMAFEARYDQGDKAAPLVVVQLRAVLTRGDNRALVAEKVFDVQVRAADNRLGAIVAAYDHAVAQTFSELLPWVASAGQAARIPAA